MLIALMPTNRAQLISIIRFNLSELKAQNGHHDFEHLCRYLARLRVYSNVLPATGPVGAGGDGGRDFETFIASVSRHSTAGSTFAQRTSGSRKVAFGCSLQEAIEPKIRADVTTITAGEGEVDEIIYFCEPNVPIAKRQALQSWAKSERNVELQVFDGQAIAELLSDRDTFWIAQQYLRVPSELLPRLADDPDWYSASLARWRERIAVPISQADFLEIKWALRRATFDLDARRDLLFWMERLAPFLKPDAPRAMQRTAIYEIAVASLRGKGDLTSQLDRVRDYYGDFDQWLGIADLQDAATLLVYSFAASALKQFVIESGELLNWRRQVADCLDAQIAASEGPGRRSGLLQVRGYLCALPTSEGGPLPYDEGFDFWTRMLDEAAHAPLFPVAEFADYLTKVTDSLGHHPRFPPLAARVDDLLAERGGNVLAADKAFDRALAYYDRDDLRKALEELHRAKAKWFSGGNVEGLQRALFLASRCYLELRLPLAAKYYALAIAYAARHSGRKEAEAWEPDALFAAANADDGSGASLSFMQLLLVAIEAHYRIDRDPLRPEQHPKIQENLGQVAALRGIARKVGEEWTLVVDNVLALWPELMRREILRLSEDPAGFWNERSWENVWAEIKDSFLQAPFSDAGPTRTCEWKALGVHWTATFANTYETVPSAEQFVAQLQVGLASFGGVDLGLLPTRVTLEIVIKPSAQTIEVRRVANSKPGLNCVFDLPSNTGAADNNTPTSAVAAVVTILRLCSVLPDSHFVRTIEGMIKVLAENVVIGRAYEELYREFVPRELFNETVRGGVGRFMPERSFVADEHPSLPWFDGPGPTYSASVSAESIHSRYERGTKCAGLTVKRLMADTGTRAQLMCLRGDGLKDWEILSIIANVVINRRVPLPEPDHATAEELQRVRDAFEIMETSATALSPSDFSPKTFGTYRLAFLTAHLAWWGLTEGESSVDVRAVETFLSRRYGLRTDDVDHDDIFGWGHL
jgi:tetratricopeptide (TPR) repeat protein